MQQGCNGGLPGMLGVEGKRLVSSDHLADFFQINLRMAERDIPTRESSTKTRHRELGPLLNWHISKKIGDDEK
jgi:cell fate regulator YaaT (PSP1 superfamily)